MKDNILIKILAVLFCGFILNTCVLDKKQKTIEIKKEIVNTDSAKLRLNINSG